MLAIVIDGYSLAALVVSLIAIVLIAVLAVRLVREHDVRITRVGLFVERDRFDSEKPRPIPPPTPCPPPKPLSEQDTEIIPPD